MTRQQVVDFLRRNKACPAAIEWLERQEPRWTPAELWRVCPHARWSVWLLLTLHFDLRGQLKYTGIVRCDGSRIADLYPWAVVEPILTQHMEVRP